MIYQVLYNSLENYINVYFAIFDFKKDILNMIDDVAGQEYVYYCAYGSNMCIDRLLNRIGDNALLDKKPISTNINAKLVFGASIDDDWSAATITSKTDDDFNALALLWKVNTEAIAKLDKFEGLFNNPKYYERYAIPVEIDGHDEIAYIYIHDVEQYNPDGVPSIQYKQFLLCGAQFFFDNDGNEIICGANEYFNWIAAHEAIDKDTHTTEKIYNFDYINNAILDDIAHPSVVTNLEDILYNIDLAFNK